MKANRSNRINRILGLGIAALALLTVAPAMAQNCDAIVDYSATQPLGGLLSGADNLLGLAADSDCGAARPGSTDGVLVEEFEETAPEMDTLKRLRFLLKMRNAREAPYEEGHFLRIFRARRAAAEAEAAE